MFDYQFNQIKNAISTSAKELGGKLILSFLILSSALIIINIIQLNDKEPIGIEHVNTFNADRQGMHSEFIQGIHFRKGDYLLYLHQEDNVNKVTIYRIIYTETRN